MRSARDALLEAMIPAPGAGLPAMAELNLAAFWARFDAVAPLPLRLGFGGVALLLVYAMPWLLGFGRPWGRLSQGERDRLLERCGASPLLGPTQDLVKLVACFAYFDDGRVQATLRAGRGLDGRGRARASIGLDPAG